MEIINIINQIIEERQIICLTKFGSHLYGINNKNSDLDYKGVFLPLIEEILLGKIPKSLRYTTNNNSGKNTNRDIDIEMYSLHYFIKLACENQTVAIDMLHSNKQSLIISSYIWDSIVKNRHKFYTKTLTAFLGYIKKQASKYGVKGSRLNAAKQVLDFLNQFDDELRIHEIWDKLPTGEYQIKYENDENGIKHYEVCNRKIQETVTISYAKSILQKFYDNYGKRAELAAKNEGIDWKAICHAFRSAFQCKQLLTEGTITFPLKESDFLKRIKNGELNYQNEIAPLLDSLVDEVEELSRKSNLPEKVDRKFWDDFICTTIINYFNLSKLVNGGRNET